MDDGPMNWKSFLSYNFNSFEMVPVSKRKKAKELDLHEVSLNSPPSKSAGYWAKPKGQSLMVLKTIYTGNEGGEEFYVSLIFRVKVGSPHQRQQAFYKHALPCALFNMPKEILDEIAQYLVAS